MTTQPTSADRWAALGFRPPDSDLAEPDQPVTVDYLHDGRIAVITLNRPAVDNAITTEMGALLTEIVESIAIRTRSASRDPHRSRQPSLLRRQRPAATQGHDQAGLAAAKTRL